jgi:hypothetical protein
MKDRQMDQNMTVCNREIKRLNKLGSNMSEGEN